MKNDVNALKRLYEYLYEENVVAAEEDYLEYFEAGFSPDKCIASETDAEKLLLPLNYLVGELLDDTEDEDLVREWAMEGGADDELLSMLGLV